MPARSALLVSVLAAALLSGCSGSDAAPKVLPPVTPTPTMTPAAATALPAAARAATSQGLDAFVRFYFKQLNAAFSTSDASLLRPYSDETCATCNNYIHALDRRRDEYIRGDSFVVSGVAAPPLGRGGETSVDVTGTIPDRQKVRSDGTVIKRLPAGGPFHFTVSVLRDGEGWRVRSIQFARQR